MSGNNTTTLVGVQGTQGLSSPFNYPGARSSSVSWIDSSGSLWMFGGYGSGYAGYGDLFLSLCRWIFDFLNLKESGKTSDYFTPGLYRWLWKNIPTQ